MRRWLRDNGLTLALLGLFAFSLVGQALAGWRMELTGAETPGRPPDSLAAYLAGGAFLSALFENWESEFLQMWAFVMLTAYLYQRGSEESKDPDRPAPQDRDPALDAGDPDAPWPVRAGGPARALYSHSLGLALLALFVASFVLHWLNSTRHAAREALARGAPAPSPADRLVDPAFWFESFQNWQSEFLSTAVLIVLAIYLRERRSPESKPVGAPQARTGD
ncbi:MAG: DUF6766 family protein [Pseudomonadota bacterium]